MKLTIITSVPHIIKANQYLAYGPYVQEMNVWGGYVDELVVVAPVSNELKSAIDSAYEHTNIKFKSVIKFDVLSMKAILRAGFSIPKNILIIFTEMHKADHIHIRCPGNIGLLGCIVQVFFPNKSKTAKYAGNWDPKVKQPWTYKLQQKIIQNSFLTRNMQVLIYGEWEGQTKNCKSFFTASYYETEKRALVDKNLDSKITFIFVGSLVKGKNPMFAVQVVHELFNKGFDVCLNLFGEGVERNNLETYLSKNNLVEVISLKGNQDKETLKKAYQGSHFVILPSESEGWPKAIAEGMFWGCVPVATSVSCVPSMLDYGNRGVLLNMNLNQDVLKIASVLKNNTEYKIKQKKAFEWSQGYTLEVFEAEIKKLII
jgi:glycosyltransferase involved in cell wall biosynthesis